MLLLIIIKSRIFSVIKVSSSIIKVKIILTSIKFSNETIKRFCHDNFKLSVRNSNELFITPGFHANPTFIPAETEDVVNSAVGVREPGLEHRQRIGGV